MKEFFALMLLAEIVQKSEINHYQSTDLLLRSFVFNEMMSMIRYQVILEFLHFSDNSNHDLNNPAGGKLFKIHPIMEYLVTKFQTPGKNILIDEELILPKGRLNFKQYIPNKRSCFGMKFTYGIRMSMLVKMRLTKAPIY